jgi:hypothetical protein
MKASRTKKSTPQPGPVTTKLLKVEIEALLARDRQKAKPPGSGLRPALSEKELDVHERRERRDTVPVPAPAPASEDNDPDT